MSTNNKRKILIDSSSVILLFRSGVLPLLLENYSCIISEGVYNELVKDGYEGADFIAGCCRTEKIEVISAVEKPGFIDVTLGTGEREVISLFSNGAGEFIIIDDKKGSSFCRRKGIPYINALLAVKILYLQNLLAPDFYSAVYEWLKNNGRYSQKVITWADKSTLHDLTFFYK